MSHVKCLFFRPYWRCYYSNTDAIIYVVDSCDRERIAISKSELISMLEVRGDGGGDEWGLRRRGGVGEIKGANLNVVFFRRKNLKMLFY